MPLNAELAALLRLTLVPGVGPHRARLFTERFGSAVGACAATAAELRAIPNVGPKLANAFTTALANVTFDEECKLLERHGVRLYGMTEPDFPPPLQTIPSPPALMYAKGTWRPDDVRAVGIVGSRGCTSYGVSVTQSLARGLVQAGYVVVSGLAWGIDAAAHRAALEAGGRTHAVLANGLASVYPAEHASLADAVSATGCLFSEAAMRDRPVKGMFHTRNRIIAGLSLAVVVIEANESSGALITARHAAEQGKEVYVVPGNVDSPASRGSLGLLRDGARLIRDVDDLLEDLAGIAITPAKQSNTPTPIPAASLFPDPPQLDSSHAPIWNLLTEPMSIDDLSAHMNVGVAELTRLLMMMEMKRIVRRLPGNRYERRIS